MENKEIKVSNKFIYMLLAGIALGLLVLCKICACFGVISGVFYGIMSIFIYAASLTVTILSYLSEKKPNPEFWVNFAVLLIAIAF